MKKRIVSVWVSLLLFALLTACGGGGGGGEGGTIPVPHAVAMLALTTGGDTIGSIDLVLDLPEGFHLATDGAGGLLEGVLQEEIADVFTLTEYLPEDAFNLGRLHLVLISPEGFTSGAFLSLRRPLAAGELLPPAEAFVVSSLTVTNLEGVGLSGYDFILSLSQETTVP